MFPSTAIPRAIRPALGALALLAAAVLAVPPAAHAQADSVTLRFDWPIGMRARVDSRAWSAGTTRGRPDTTTHEWSTILSVEPHPQGRRIVFDLSLAVAQASRVTPYGVAHFDSAAADLRPALVVNARGEAMGWEDTETLLAMIGRHAASALDTSDAARSAFGPLLAKLSRPELLTDMLEEQWSIAVGFWTDATLEVGAAYALDLSLPWPFAPNVTIPSTFEFGVASAEACGDERRARTCVELVGVSTPVGDSIGALAQRTFAQPLAPDVPGFRFEGMNVEERISILADASTLVPSRIVKALDAEVKVIVLDSIMPIRRASRVEHVFTLDAEPPPLHQAAAAGDLARVRALLAQNVEPDPVDFDRETPLYAAAAAGHAPIVRDLVAAGASAEHAYDVARSRGLLEAMRLLAPHLARRADPLPLDSGITLFVEGYRPSAVAVFAELAARESRPGIAHAWLAEMLRRLGEIERATATARAAAAGERCEALAHLVLAQTLDPAVARWAGAHADSARRHRERAVSCAPDDGNVWRLMAFLAARHGDAEMEARALREQQRTGFLTPSALAFGRWMLELLPPGAVVITADAEQQALRGVQVIDGVRPDVVIVDRMHLEHDAYVRAIAARADLPLPRAPAGGQAGTGGDAPVRSPASRVVQHWIDERLQSRLARPVVIGGQGAPDISFQEGMVGGPGPFIQVRPDPTHWPSPADVLALYRRASLASMDGPITSPADRFSRVSRSSFALAVVAGAIGYVHSAGEAAVLDRESMRALEELVGWIEASADSLDPEGASFVRQQLGNLHLGLAAHWTRVGDQRQALRHGETATRYAPLDANAWNSYGYRALVLGDFATARTAIQRADAIRPALAHQLNIATAFRYLGQLDSALTWLGTAERMTEAESRNDPSYMWGPWELTYLPRWPGDTVSMRMTATVDGADEKRSLIHYYAAIVHAMRGDPGAADLAFARGRSLGHSTELRCYVAASMEAAGGFARLSARARTWLERQREELRRGLSCPAVR